MRREFLVERQGRQFVLYAGLLSLGHEQGLKSIRTQLIQIPTEDNKRVAIVSATVVLERDGKEREFHGLGDACPANVAQAMVHCLIRLAETRAKARALRDAVNVGMAALEELGDDEVYEGAPERGYTTETATGRGSAAVRSGRQATRPLASRVQGRAAEKCPYCPATNGVPGAHHAPNCSRFEAGAAATSAAGMPTAAQSNLVTEAQMDAIRSLCRRGETDAEQIAKSKTGKALMELTQTEASGIIKQLQTAPRRPIAAGN